MSTALVQPASDISREQLELIKRTVAKGATDDELQLFLHDCKRRGINPLDKLLHFTVRTDKQGRRTYTPITSIDYMRIRAAESGEYAGNDDPVITFGDDPKFPVAATVTVWRIVATKRCAFTATARWEEYHPDLSESKSFMWKKMPTTMLGKCAEALALRKGFPGQLQGLYAREEMDQSGNEPKMEPSDARDYANQAVAATLPAPSSPAKGLTEPPLTTALRKSVEREAPKDFPPLPDAFKDYQEDDAGFASFTLLKVDRFNGKNGEYRRLYWNGGSINCFKAPQFGEIDALESGDRVAVSGVTHGPKGSNFVKLEGVITGEDQMVAALAEAKAMPTGPITDEDIPF